MLWAKIMLHNMHNEKNYWCIAIWVIITFLIHSVVNFELILTDLDNFKVAIL